jgi:DNA mismatch repair ATPase MutL
VKKVTHALWQPSTIYQTADLIPTEIASTLGNLKLSTKTPQKPAHKPKSKPVADSWDEDVTDGSDTETETEVSKSSNSASSPHDSLDPISTISSNDISPHPPPPTPASPTPFEFPDNVPYGAAARGRGDGRGGASLDKRPEKTTAVAGRLIAGALGVRAPKRTDEEREFDRVMREKERKRRTEDKEREKREQEEAEKRKKAVWDD